MLVSGKDKPGTLQMKLVDANPAPEVQGRDELSSKSYYYIGNDPNKWHSKVANYARVRYQAVYPGVDLVYYGNQRQLEYDFLVAPRVDPKRIELSFSGAQDVRIDGGTGNLKLEYGGGEIQFQKPVAYQVSGDGKSLVQAQYVLKEEQISAST